MQQRKKSGGRDHTTSSIRLFAGNSRSVSYGNKYKAVTAKSSGGAERQRSSGRGERSRNRNTERPFTQNKQRNTPDLPISASKKRNWWNALRRWPWYKFFLRKYK